jgi:anti-sigma B factor antagonist
MILDFNIIEENNIQILKLSGELIDKHQAETMMLKIDELLQLGKTKLVINLEGLKYVNSSGLNVLIQLLTKTRNAGGESIICNVSKKVNDLLIITKLNTLFKVVEAQNDAIALLN